MTVTAVQKRVLFIFSFDSSYGLGAIGDLVSLYIFYSQEEFRKISTGLLYLFMTMFNALHLATLGIDFLRLSEINLYGNTILQCGFNLFIQNVTRAISTYFAVAIAIDRLIRSELPIQSRFICTKRNVAILTVIYVVIFSAIWSFFLYRMSFYDFTKNQCTSPPEAYSYFSRNIHDTARAIIVCVIPILVITGANLRLMVNIRASRRRVHGKIEMTRDASTMYPGVNTGPDGNTGTGRRVTSFDRMILYMMIANVVTLFVTQTPFHVDQIRSNYVRTVTGFESRLLRSYLLIWSSLYFGIGFYVYCLSAPLFRQKSIKILKNLLFQRHE